MTTVGPKTPRLRDNSRLPQNMRQDLAGQRFGKLTVVSFDPSRSGKGKGAYWNIRCDCGTEKVSSASVVKRSYSCGCYMPRSLRHGEGTRGFVTTEYKAWCSMVQRCCTPSHKSYPDYGGRGITVSERWLESYENFLADMGRKPSSKHSIERTNNHLGYGPGNCIWATQTAQIRNRRSTVKIRFNGKDRPLYEVAETVGVDPERLRSRIKAGWSVEEALSRPKMERGERR